ncbi:DUF1015 family protein [Geomonas subterranea]|uniref:DUF1015 family protein n=1 Tax=Geomonas subterranea TaxID=2847989 RepID=A0ABX8LGI4_9BACT|nr:DUF1015 family protein [Geomonas subterranea]QXE90838.1 DUF1015 family protein [Geomonas subterranea]QXM11079.1 DUF1015 family protein [Geomonas subterranea]
MAFIKPFKAVRPKKELAEKVAALPYDVMNTDEAIQMAAGNPVSFLHISRPEIDLPRDVDVHSDPVYVKGRENLERFLAEGTLQQDESERYYVYRQKMGSITQTGLVVCAGVDDYQTGTIKKHELTRADKEEDRVRHIDALNANDEPVFYTYRNDPALTATIDKVTQADPIYDFTTDDGVSHALWDIADPKLIDSLTKSFAAIPTLYVADGHHRSAAASRVRDLRRDANPEHTGTEEYNYFLTVIFPDNEMTIMPYNRVVKDLNGRGVAEFMARVGERFEVTPVSSALSPGERHHFGMYLGGKWYELTPREDSFPENDPVASMDVSILQDNLLSPVLGVRNPRTDQRIHFVGGIRGVEELERVVNSGEYMVAFSLFPTSIEELMSLADEDKIMPPKSTWFEPKLRSGLFIHMLD